jgi:hypothetical protein
VTLLTARQNKVGSGVSTFTSTHAVAVLFA